MLKKPKYKPKSKTGYNSNNKKKIAMINDKFITSYEDLSPQDNRLRLELEKEKKRIKKKYLSSQVIKDIVKAENELRSKEGVELLYKDSIKKIVKRDYYLKKKTGGWYSKLPKFKQDAYFRRCYFKILVSRIRKKREECSGNSDYAKKEQRKARLNFICADSKYINKDIQLDYFV